jgi:hypothetical protein
MRKTCLTLFTVLVAVLAVLAVPGLALAAEAPTVSAPDISGAPLWQQIIYTVIAALVSMLLLPYLKRKADAVGAEIEKLKAEAASGKLNTLALLENNLLEFLLRRAATIAEKDFPALASAVMAHPGEWDAEKIKARLREWGAALKAEAIEHFKSNKGIDLLATIGDDQLDKLIRYVADKVSPFPGKDTAVELLTEKGSNMLVDKGVAWLREKYLSEGTGG